MDGQLRALYAAVGAVLRCRRQVQAAGRALRRGRQLPRWTNPHLLDELEDELSRAQAHHRAAEAELLARWEEFNAS